MDQLEKKPSAVPKVFSIISLAFSILALICAVLLILVVNFGPERGGTSTALTGRAVLTVSGMIALIPGIWGFALIGGLFGFIMTIVDIAMKRISILWMPAAAVVLGIVSIVICGMTL